MKPSMVKRTGLGLVHIFTGIRLIKSNSKLASLAIIPFVIDVVLLIIGFNWGWGRISGVELSSLG